ARRVVTMPDGKERRPPVLGPSVQSTIDYLDQSVINYLAPSHELSSDLPGTGTASARLSGPARPRWAWLPAAHPSGRIAPIDSRPRRPSGATDRESKAIQDHEPPGHPEP